MGRKVRHSPVLYTDFELTADEQHRRAFQIARGVYLERPPHDLLYVTGVGSPAGEVLSACLDICIQHSVGFAVIDSLGIAMESDAEASRDVVRFHRQHLDPLRAAGVTLLVIDHQAKTQAGERYQGKRAFGSVFKENLARSVLQVEPGDRGEGLLTLIIRQTKHNFGPKTAPFGARLTFSEEEITLEERSLEAAELAEEKTVNAGDRVLLILKGGPAYPADIAEKAKMPLGTTKNQLTQLRKRRLIEHTGERDPGSKAIKVRLTEDGRSVTGVTDTIEERDTVTPGRTQAEPVLGAPRSAGSGGVSESLGPTQWHDLRY